MFDLRVDPHGRHNLLFDPKAARRPEVAMRFGELKAEIRRLQQQYGDDGMFSDLRDLPKVSVDRRDLKVPEEKGDSDTLGPIRASVADGGKG